MLSSANVIVSGRSRMSIPKCLTQETNLSDYDGIMLLIIKLENMQVPTCVKYVIQSLTELHLMKLYQTVFLPRLESIDLPWAVSQRCLMVL